MPDVVLDRLTKRFGEFAAVDAIDLHIKDGEMITLLGPSGCGKTTTLRMLAGLESPDGGRISIGGTTVVDVDARVEVPPEKRNLGMVFQSYAIWPHMTVAENVQYPLKVRGKLGKSEIATRVQAALRQVGLDDFGSRSSTLLSGGQQQRVALARAIVFEPTLLLLDEPLSNLDAKLRDQMRYELKDMQRRIGVTAIYVTHDQTEALTLSDRIVVMKGGVIEQVGTPEEIYGAPKSQFVAAFIGKSNMIKEIVDREVQGHSARFTISTFDGPRTVTAASEKRPVPEDGVIAIRPEHITVLRPGADEASGTEWNHLPGKVTSVAYLGHSLEGVVSVGPDIDLRVIFPAGAGWQNGQDALLRIHPSSVMVVR